MSRGWIVIVLPACVIAFAAVLLPPLAQPPEYHRFADTRAWFGVPNFFDVASNLAFLVVAVTGFFIVFRDPSGRGDRLSYALFFLALAVTAFGSAWYHLAPDNERLYWDRLPITICLAALLSAVITERLGIKSGRLLLGPLAAVGAGTVWYWLHSELMGAGNVLPYFAFQLYTLLAILLLMHLCPSRYGRGENLFRAVMLYGAAVLAELFDRQIFALGEVVSGHTLKHILVGTAAYLLVRMLRRRQG